MPLDYRILGQLEPAHFDTPQESMGKMLALRQQQNAVANSDLVLKQNQQQFDRSQQIFSTVQKYGSIDKALDSGDIDKIDAFTANEWRAQRDQSRATLKDMLGKATDAQRKRQRESFANVSRLTRNWMNQYSTPEDQKAHYPELLQAFHHSGEPVYPDINSQDATVAPPTEDAIYLPNVQDFDPTKDAGRLHELADYADIGKEAADQLDAEARASGAQADAVTKWTGVAAQYSPTTAAEALDIRQQMIASKAPAAAVARVPIQMAPGDKNFGETWSRFRENTLTQQQRETAAFERQKARAAEEHDIQMEAAANPFASMLGGPARARIFGGGGGAAQQPPAAPFAPPQGPRPAQAQPPAPPSTGTPSQTQSQPQTQTQPQPPDPTGPHGEEFLKGLPPQLAQEIRSLAQGKTPFPTGMSMSRLQPLIQAVTQYDPTFEASNYANRAKTRADFTSGRPNTPGGQINALNTALGHMQMLSEAAQALHNGNVHKYNEIVNWLTKEFGGTYVINYETAQKAVADETTRVWRGTGGSEADIINRMSNLDVNNSLGQQNAAIAGVAELLESKIQALQNTYDQAMGPLSDIKMLSPQSTRTLRQLRERAGILPPVIRTDSDGNRIVVPQPRER